LKLFVSILAVITIFFGCSEQPKVDLNEKISGTNTPAYQEAIVVGEENFNLLVSYIEKNGFVVIDRGIPCDHQYTFYDSHGNRHALITIKRDGNGMPSMNGVVDQISVWAYEKGIRDQEHFFGYQVREDGVHNFLPELEKKYFYDIKRGYEELLKKVKGGVEK